MPQWEIAWVNEDGYRNYYELEADDEDDAEDKFREVCLDVDYIRYITEMDEGTYDES